MSTATFTATDLAALSDEFETMSARRIVQWAVDNFHPDLCIASSMADTVAVAIALEVEPTIEVLFLDTQYHFPETWATVDAMKARYPGLNLRIMKPDAEPDELWKRDLEACCGVRKVEPLNRGLAGRVSGTTADVAGRNQTRLLNASDAAVGSAATGRSAA